MALANATGEIYLQVQPYLPDCVDYLNPADYSLQDAQDFNPASGEYYKSVIPSLIPAIVFACLAFLGFIVTCVWMCIRGFCCCHCCSKKGKTDAILGDPEKVISTDATDAVEPAVVEPTAGSKDALSEVAEDLKETVSSVAEPQASSHTKWGWIYLILLAVIAAVACLMSIWGIVTSINMTDGQISNFWGLVDTVDERLNTTTVVMTKLNSTMDGLQNGYNMVANAENEILEFKEKIPLINRLDLGLIPDITLDGPVMTTVGTAVEKVDAVQAKLTDVEQKIKDTVGDAITQIKSDYKGPSMTFEDRGRYVAIIIGFSMNMLLIILSVILVWNCRKNMACAFFTVALLWLSVMILMIFGMGVMNGINQVTQDSCLYLESAVFDYVKDRVGDPERRQWANKALTYYLTPTEEEQAEDDPIKGFFDVDVSDVLNIVNGGGVDGFRDLLANPDITAASALGGLLRNGLQEIVSNVDGFGDGVVELKNIAKIGNVVPLYHQAKSYICCDYAKASKKLYTAWTCVGFMTFFTALLCTARLMYMTMNGRK